MKIRTHADRADSSLSSDNDESPPPSPPRRDRKMLVPKGPKAKNKASSRSRERGALSSDVGAYESDSEDTQVKRARAEGYMDGYSAAMKKFRKGSH